jgi:hypothetical protein
MEARAGIEPAIEVLQTSALPLGYRALSRKAELAGKNDARKRRFKTKLSQMKAFSGGARHPRAPVKRKSVWAAVMRKKRRKP